MTRRARSWIYAKGIALGIWRWAVPTAAVLISALALVQLYYFAMPGSHFLRYEEAKVQASFEGDPVTATVCRTRQIGAVQANATRTFYRSDVPTGGFKSVSSYSFSPNIEAGERCIDVTVTPERFRHTAGYWKYHTDLTFEVGGYEKTTSFDSNVYRILPRPTNQELQLQLELKIQDLQRQLDELKLSAANVNATTARRDSTAQTNQPTTSAPPEASASSTPARQVGSSQQGEPTPPAESESGLLDAIVRGVVGLVR